MGIVMVMQVLIILAALVMSLSFNIFFRSNARCIGLIDVPQGRKLHDGITAVVGGAAMFAS